jgi:single-strand DNA-binding protein
MNKIVLMGRIANDLFAKTLPSGKAVMNFNIAVPRRFGKDTADFFSCTAWENTARFIEQYFEKGSMIAVIGRLQTRSWEDNGLKKYATDIVVEEAYFTGERRNTEQEQNTTSSPISREVEEFYGFRDIEDDTDLPF